MLEIKQLTRSYDGFRAVDNVNFTIGMGEIVGLLGHNGAGKTTIMKMISGSLEPDSGNIKVNGIELSKGSNLIQSELGYLPESLPVYPEMIVADYLDYAADLKGLKGTTKASEITRAIQATDISSKLLANISTLSRGFKQRVGVAQAILGHPKLLILDEPTNGLDPEQTQHMRDLIKEIAKDATVILSTHIMQEVEALCSRVLMLNSGSLAVDEKLEELTKTRHLILETSSLTQAKLDEITAISGLEEVKVLNQSEEDKTTVYCLKLADSFNSKSVSANIAKKIIEINETLYRLTPQHRDLETLFREVSEQKYQQGGLNHAA